LDGANLWIVESGLKAGDTVIVDGIARLQPNGHIMLGGGPGGPGAGSGAPEAKGNDATTGKDGAKAAPPPKS
jgi:hypothetical protein